MEAQKVSKELMSIIQVPGSSGTDVLENTGGLASTAGLGMSEDMLRVMNCESRLLIVLAGDGGRGGSISSDMRTTHPLEPEISMPGSTHHMWTAHNPCIPGPSCN